MQVVHVGCILCPVCDLLEPAERKVGDAAVGNRYGHVQMALGECSGSGNGGEGKGEHWDVLGAERGGR